MDEIIPNLWIGDLSAALNAKYLRQKNIHSVVTVMVGNFTIHETFTRHQIAINDTDDTDVLVHFPPAIAFIQKQLDRGCGVLVHCVAGISRSATIVTAYLMYTRGLDAPAALQFIRQYRPTVEPNAGFLKQLEIFHQNGFNVSESDKSTRMFYLDKATQQIKNGDATHTNTMFSSYPQPSVASQKAPPRRRIRCKMCRRELATKEHMVGHGLGDRSAVSQSLPSHEAIVASMKLGNDLFTETSMGQAAVLNSECDPVVNSQSDDRPTPPTGSPPKSTYIHPSGLSAQLYSNPKLAVLRSPIPSLLSRRISSANKLHTPAATFILADSKCSGYFVEPMKWMALAEGQRAGKIICPNARCKAKLGNYDWAGVCCGCKEWVVPGICIHRSKVDEIE